MPVSPPLDPFVEFFEMADASRPNRIADLPAHDAAAARLRTTLEEYGLDLSDATVLAAVTAGVVEALGAAHEYGSPVRGALALGWALSDLSQPHLTAHSVAV